MDYGLNKPQQQKWQLQKRSKEDPTKDPYVPFYGVYACGGHSRACRNQLCHVKPSFKLLTAIYTCENQLS